jgi:hypothetical protein
MVTNHVHYRFGSGGPQLRGPRPGLFGRVVAGIAGAAALIVGLVLSFAVFVGLATAAVAIGGWLLWKTRALRRQLRERHVAPAGGRIIEGEVVHEPESRDADLR